jgi:hypothetical protein
VLEQFSGKQLSPLMEMVRKQSSPFMELFGQLCLTVWATVSYCLGNCVLPLMEMVAPQRRIYFGSAQNDYRIALDKESHFSKETTVTMPHSQKFPFLMSL